MPRTRSSWSGSKLDKIAKEPPNVQVRRMGEKFNPSWTGQTIYAPHPRSAPQGPYTPEEIADIIDWCYTPYESLNYERRLIVGLGLGAGLTSREMSRLRWSDVEVDPRGVIVTVGEKKIPMTMRWAEFLDLSRAGQESYVLRPDTERREPRSVTEYICQKKLWNGMRPDIRKLKATWVVDLMDRYVPDAFICHAAGIKSLKRYEPYRPDLGDSDLEMVRGLFHGDGGSDGLSVV